MNTQERQVICFCILQLIYKENRTDGFSKPNRTRSFLRTETEPNLKNQFRTSLLSMYVSSLLLSLLVEAVPVISGLTMLVHWQETHPTIFNSFSLEVLFADRVTTFLKNLRNISSTNV